MNLQHLHDAAEIAAHNSQLVAVLAPISAPQARVPLAVSMSVTVNLPEFDERSFVGLVMAPKHCAALEAAIRSARLVRLLNDEHVVGLDRRAWQEFLDAFGITVDA